MKHIACISVKSFQKLRERENVHLLSILNSQDYDDPDKTKPWQFQCGSSFPGPWLKLELNLIPGSQLWMSARDICSPQPTWAIPSPFQRANLPESCHPTAPKKRNPCRFTPVSPEGSQASGRPWVEDLVELSEASVRSHCNHIYHKQKFELDKNGEIKIWI